MLLFFNDTATTEIYTLSLHDALPISPFVPLVPAVPVAPVDPVAPVNPADRKSTRLNSSHLGISYAVFCLIQKTDRMSTRLNSSHLGISHTAFWLENIN